MNGSQGHLIEAPVPGVVSFGILPNSIKSASLRDVFLMFYCML